MIDGDNGGCVLTLLRNTPSRRPAFAFVLDISFCRLLWWQTRTYVRWFPLLDMAMMIMIIAWNSGSRKYFSQIQKRCVCAINSYPRPVVQIRYRNCFEINTYLTSFVVNKTEILSHHIVETKFRNVQLETIIILDDNDTTWNSDNTNGDDDDVFVVVMFVSVVDVYF